MKNYDQFLFITYDKNKELTFASYYSDLDEVFLKHRFKIPHHILKMYNTKWGYASNSSSDGSGCLLFDIHFFMNYTGETFSIDIDFNLQKLLTSALREVKLNYLGI